MGKGSGKKGPYNLVDESSSYSWYDWQTEPELRNVLTVSARIFLHMLRLDEATTTTINISVNEEGVERKNLSFNARDRGEIKDESASGGMEEIHPHVACVRLHDAVRYL